MAGKKEIGHTVEGWSDHEFLVLAHSMHISLIITSEARAELLLRGV